MDLTLLKELCEINGISGDESRVARYIISKIEGHCESWTVDPMGNLLVHKKGKERAAKKVLFSAHMDEVGMLVTGITDEGYLNLTQIGIDERVVLGRQVAVGHDAIPGVIGTKPIHLTKGDERESAVKLKDMAVDIGCTSKEEAEKLVSPGDPVYFASAFERLGEKRIKAKAIDDRFGCAVMIEMIQSELPYDCWFAFVVQEEVGLRGATAAGYTIDPDYAVVLETTASGDQPGVSAPENCCKLGGGAVVPFMDRGTVYPRSLYRRCMALAKEKGIPVQTKTVIAGGNDAGAYQKARGGVKCLNLSAAGRCLHTPCVITDLDDMEAVGKLARELAALLPAYEE